MTILTLPPRHREEMIARLMAFLKEACPGKPLEVHIQPKRKRRSVHQNRALWGVAYKVLADATGHELEDIHTYMLGEWSGWHTVDVFGKKKHVPWRRSSKLSTVEFHDYYAFVQRRAAQLGLYVPDPNEGYEG